MEPTAFLSLLGGHLARVDGGDWWAKPGECLMSGADALTAGNGLMILGLNPGGSATEESKLPPLSAHLTEELARPTRFSAYLDQCWHYAELAVAGWPSGDCARCAESRMVGGLARPVVHQKRVQEIAAVLRVDLRLTLAMNAFWLQTRDAVALAAVSRGRTPEDRAVGAALSPVENMFRGVYFPIIERVIEGAGIRAVVCLGNGRGLSPFGLLMRALHSERPDDRSFSRAYRDGRSFRDERTGLSVFGVPHPSMHTLSESGSTALAEWGDQAAIERQPTRPKQPG